MLNQDYEDENYIGTVDLEEVEEDEPKEECICGNICNNCLGIGWRDFI